MATFKTRARTLDMLGRQQIAGIPTAISELFKNAHDAYADNVIIDYYRQDGLFVLRDDGVGMTEDEFRDRWLTIGTESKLNAVGMAPPAIDVEKSPRPMLGEKGIGRLAIATIGPQVLVLTRARRNGELHDLVAAFVNWGLFECPGIDLEDIVIPVRSFDEGQIPSKVDVEGMVSEFRQNLDRLRDKLSEEYHTRIGQELSRFAVDPQDIASYLGPPSLSGIGAGTHFIILPTSELLPSDIDGERGVDRATPLTKALLGFTNTMTPGHTDPVIVPAFREHATDEDSVDLIASGEFFTPQEFEDSDHHVLGRFDEYGQFAGTVSIYGEAVTDHVIPWQGASGTRTACGPFRISFAAIQGHGSASTLPPEDHARMVAKMNKLGGLYIYRDGVRVLPYGDTDYDWIDIEYNRTKSASYYYFSFRRIFGAIELSHRGNPNLCEKAGREGFMANKAYLQMKSILKNFFVQIAADFFRKEGVHGERYDERKAQLLKEEMDRRRRAEQVTTKRNELAQKLKEFFDSIETGKPQEQALLLTQEITDQVKRACRIADEQQAGKEVLRVEMEAHTKLRGLEETYLIKRPRIGLSKALVRDWREYEREVEELRTSVFKPTRDMIEGIVGEEAERARLAINRRIRVENSLAELSQQARRTTKDDGTTARREALRVAGEVREVAGQCIREVETELRSVLSDFERQDVSTLDDAEFVKTRDELESRILKAGEEKAALLQAIQAQLEQIKIRDNSTTLDQLVAVEQRNVTLEEAAETDFELAQLGGAISIISHEFTGTILSLRNNLRRLKAWADINQDMAGLYQNIRASFDHLDGYLTLFTPLQRRLYRKAVDIRGGEIFKFLHDLFEDRFKRHDVTLYPTDTFKKSRIRGYPSSFYPVFVNLVDNAIYWLSSQAKGRERRITLDWKQGGFSISDTGPGISARDREAIFEMGFTRKPGGRGMGLHISCEALRRVGYRLLLAESRDGVGATFIIRPFDELQTEEQAP
jgi:signal transduction histidine kinase